MFRLFSSRCRSLVSLATALLPIAAVHGAFGQESLYGRQPGRDAVFLRFVNASASEVTIKSDQVTVQTLGTAEGKRIGTYELIEHVDAKGLSISVQSGGSETKEVLKLTPGSKTSVLLRPDAGALRVTQLVQKADLNQSRTILSFFNAAPECGPTSLTLQPAGAVVFPDVPVDADRSRGINPVNANFKAACGDRGEASASLERPDAGGAYSVWLLATGGHPTLIVGSDTLPTWKP